MNTRFVQKMNGMVSLRHDVDEMRERNGSTVYRCKEINCGIGSLIPEKISLRLTTRRGVGPKDYMYSERGVLFNGSCSAAIGW